VKTCAILVCDNGLGHIYRTLLSAVEISKSSIKTTIYAPIDKVKKFEDKIPDLKKLNITDFSSKTSLDEIKSGHYEPLELVKRLPDFKKYDYVISDNLIEILLVREDAFLSAQFFWHDIFRSINQSYADFGDNLLSKYSPLIFGIDLFSMNYVKSQKNFVPTGMYRNPDINIHGDNSLRSKVIITPGTTKHSFYKFESLIRKLANSVSSEIDYYIEPSLFKKNLPYFFKVANFDDEMFKDSYACICRPGLGIISKLLEFEILPFVIYEDGNLEMRHNLNVLKNNNLGFEYSNACHGSIIEYKNSRVLRKNFSRECQKINWNGSSIIADLFSSIQGCR